MSASPFPVDNTRYSAGEAMMSAVGGTLLVVTEMLGAGFALAYAVGGLLGLGETLTYGLMGVIALPSLYLALALTRRILRVEARLRAEAPSA